MLKYVVSIEKGWQPPFENLKLQCTNWTMCENWMFKKLLIEQWISFDYTESNIEGEWSLSITDKACNTQTNDCIKKLLAWSRFHKFLFHFKIHNGTNGNTKCYYMVLYELVLLNFISDLVLLNIRSCIAQLYQWLTCLIISAVINYKWFQKFSKRAKR